MHSGLCVSQLTFERHYLIWYARHGAVKNPPVRNCCAAVRSAACAGGGELPAPWCRQSGAVESAHDSAAAQRRRHQRREECRCDPLCASLPCPPLPQVASQQDCPLLPAVSAGCSSACFLVLQLPNISFFKCLTSFQHGTQTRSCMKPHKLLKLLGKKLALLVQRLPGST